MTRGLWLIVVVCALLRGALAGAHGAGPHPPPPPVADSEKLVPPDDLPADDLPAEDLPAEDLPPEDLPPEDLPPDDLSAESCLGSSLPGDPLDPTSGGRGDLSGDWTALWWWETVAEPSGISLWPRGVPAIELLVIQPVGAGPADFLPPPEPPSPLWLIPLEPPAGSDDSAGLPAWPAAVGPQALDEAPDWWADPGRDPGAAGWLTDGMDDSPDVDSAGDGTVAVAETPLPWGLRVFRRFSGLFDEWTSRIALGGRSLAGNSNQNFVDLLADFENKTPLRATQVNIGGQFGESNDRVVANRWFANSTTDFYHGPRWLTFTKLMDQYDALQNLDYRGTFSAGVGYRFLFDDQRRIITRVGPGVTLEVFHEPSDSRVTPDAFGELEVRLPLWERLKWEQKSTLFPSLSELEIARFQNVTALMYAFDERERWSLRVGFNYQYIGQPNVGKLPSDYTTNVSVMYQRK